MLIDTHCHLNFNDYKEDYLAVAQRALQNNIFMIVVGSEYQTSKRGVLLSDQFEKGLYSAVGLHPIHLEDVLVKNNNENGKYEFRSRAEEFDLQKYQNLIDSSSKVVAVGEIGLDYYHIRTESIDERENIKNKQKEVFKKQLILAQKNKLPVIIHCREAHDDLYQILLDFKKSKKSLENWGVIHCYSGDKIMAEKYFSLGLKISFTGLITFNQQWDDLIRQVPLEKIMIETDAPYLSPLPYRGKRNEPLYVREVAKKISELRGEKEEQVAEILWKNSLDFFKIKP